MTIYIQFGEDAEEYLNKQFDIMKTLDIPVESGIEEPPSVFALKGINGKVEQSGTLPVKMYYEPGDSVAEGKLKFEIEGIGVFEIASDPLSSPVIFTEEGGGG